MPIWWLKVAEEIEALQKAGVQRPAAVSQDLFAGPTIETTHRVVSRGEPPSPERLPPSEGSQPESRFHPEGHLFNTGRGESSFLAEGRRRKSNSRSWS